jgi:hypothetical protein
MTYIKLVDLLKSKKYLTSDSFQSPDLTYIYFDSENSKIMFSDFEMVYPFDLSMYSNVVFREVERKYENHYENRR